METWKDPRGPLRTVIQIQETSKASLITFDCGHVGCFNPIYSYKIGETHRCIRCKNA